MAVRQDTDPNSPTYGQMIDDGGGATPNQPTVEYGSRYDPRQSLNQIIAAYRSLGHEPTNEEIHQWGTNLSKSELDNAIETIRIQLGTGTKGGATGSATDPSPSSTTGPGSPTTPTTGTPFTGGQAEFMQMFGSPRTPAELTALEQRLNAAGITIRRNAEGIAGKIQLPDGRIVDVITSAGTGGTGFQWLEGGGGSDLSGGIDPSYLEPYTGVFNPGKDAALPALPNAPLPFSYADFAAPTADSVRASDPGYAFRVSEGLGALENSAAARGLLNSGGTLVDAQKYGQNFASQEYGQAYDRAYNTWAGNRSNEVGNYTLNKDTANQTYQTALGRSTTAYGRAWDQFMNDQDVWYKNQDGPINRLATLGRLA